MLALGPLAFAALGASALCALFALRPLWLYLLLAGIALGGLAGALGPLGFAGVLVMALVCVSFERLQARKASPGLQILAGAAVTLCALALALHLVPGFRNILVIDHLVMKPGSVPFTLALNFDKTIAGAMVLGWCWQRPSDPLAPAAAIGMTVSIIAVLVILLMAVGVSTGYLRWQPGASGWFALFAPINLVVCLSEEAFFRGFLQRQWDLAFKGPVATATGVVLSGVLFGFAHLAGGLLYVALASIAGLGYAVVFRVTRRLECSVLTHWSVNALHFLLLSYPAFARAGH